MTISRVERSSLLLLLPFFAVACSAEADEPAANDSEVRANALPLAHELPEQCASPEIVRLTRPVASDDQAKGTWSYGYRFKAPTQPGAPVLVSLPGGPGGSATGAVPTWVPEGWGYLLTDPRGVGCNTLASVPNPDVSGAFFRTTEIAQDVIAAIEHEKLERYIVFGVSYGTLLATHITHGLEEANYTPPKAVVLEGVLGRGFTKEFVAAEYIHQWDRIRGVLPADVLTELDTKEAPYGIDQIGWSRILGQFMPHGPKVVANNIAALSTTIDVPAETRKAVLETLRGMAGSAPHTAPGEVEMYRQIACREITDTVPANDLDTIFSHGKLVRNTADEGTKCKGLHLTTPFDSAKFQFAAKTYYFIGEADVATPAWQGTYHFENHHGPAVKIVTKEGGHNSLRLDQGACAVKLMASIADDGKGLDAALATCPAGAQVESK